MDTNTTGKQLVDHWTWAAEKGVMNRNSAFGMRSACSQVLSVLDNWKEIDVTSIDIEDLLKRFRNLRARDFSPSSLDAYEKRFRGGIASFLDYVNNPSGWKPTARAPRKPRSKEDGDDAKEARREDAQVPVARSEAPGLIEYPFPLRDKLVARLMLPRDLTIAEARRLYGFMNAVAIDRESESGK